MVIADSETATEAVSIAFLNKLPELIPYLIRSGRQTISASKVNAAFAIVIKLVFVVLAATGLNSLATLFY